MMYRRKLDIKIAMALWFAVGCSLAVPDDVRFAAPLRSGGMGLFSALQGHRQTASFDRQLVHWEVLGNLLWAGCGITRPDQAGHTVPLLTDRLAIKLYLLAEEGVWLYEPLEHRLIGIKRGDLRALAIAGATGLDAAASNVFVLSDEAGEDVAPVVLVYVAAVRARSVYGREPSPEGVDGHNVKAVLQAGHIAQNIALFCASEGLGIDTQVVMAEREALARALNIAQAHHLIMVQRLGYPASQ